VKPRNPRTERSLAALRFGLNQRPPVAVNPSSSRTLILFFGNYSGISFTAGNAAIPGGQCRRPPGMAAFPG